MGSLAQKVDTLRVQLGLVDGLPFAESVNVAVFQLGLADQVKGFNLVQKADACLTALGTPSASAAAAPVAPSASAAAAPDVLIGLPVGAAQAPMEIGRTAEESGTYTQPAVVLRRRRSLLCRSVSILRPMARAERAERAERAPCKRRTCSRRSLLRRST